MVVDGGNQAALQHKQKDLNMPYIVITEDGVDQVVDTKKEAEAEKRDLKAMGFSVQIRHCKTWAEVDEQVDTIDNDR